MPFTLSGITLNLGENSAIWMRKTRIKDQSKYLYLSSSTLMVRIQKINYFFQYGTASSGNHRIVFS